MTAHTAENEVRSPALSIIIPTYNESDNVAPLVARLQKTLGLLSWEVIFVDDDSPDGTSARVKQLAAKYPNVRAIRRVGRRGLASAAIEGMLASAAPFVAVMDADLQHDETILPKMLDKARAGADLVVASRYSGSGSAREGLSPMRLMASRAVTRISQLFTRSRTSDPMSGFFLMRRELAEDLAPDLAGEGFKILLDVLMTAGRRSREINVAEVPFSFRPRHAGQSKMNAQIGVQLVGLWLSKMTGGLLPVTFFMFALVGLTGLAVHMATLGLAFFQFGFNFTNAQLAAIMVAMTWNFVLNNELTYADRRLRGFSMLVGLISFYAVCSLGALANISVASVIYQFNTAAYIAGLSGAVMSAVFNYAVTRMFTWR